MLKVRPGIPVHLPMALPQHPHVKERRWSTWDFLILLRELWQRLSNRVNVKQVKLREHACMHKPVHTFPELKSTYWLVQSITQRWWKIDPIYQQFDSKLQLQTTKELFTIRNKKFRKKCNLMMIRLNFVKWKKGQFKKKLSSSCLHAMHANAFTHSVYICQCISIHHDKSIVKTGYRNKIWLHDILFILYFIHTILWTDLTGIWYILYL